MTATKHRVLIVEDDADTRDWMRRRLARQGFDAEWASSLSDALAKLQRRPCCVLLDLTLPDGNGTEILRQVRSRNLPIKVAVLTGSQDQSLLAASILLKPDAYFIKPVDWTKFVAWLRSVE